MFDSVKRFLLQRRSATLPSTFALLQKRVGAAPFAQLTAACLDKRFLFQRAAEQLGVTEDEILSEIATEAGLQFLPHVMPMEVSALPSGFTLPMFRDRGAIGITREGMLLGAVGIDPAQLLSLFPSATPANLCVSSWDQISRALSRSEELYREQREKKREQEERNFRDQFSEIWKVILGEMIRLQGSDLRLHFHPEVVEYSFCSQQSDARAKGTVHSSMRERLLDALQKRNLTGERLSSITPLPGGVSFALTVDLPRSVVPLLPQSLSRNESSVSRVPKSDGSIVIVDDSATFGKILERFFERMDLRTHHYQDARKALADLVGGNIHPGAIVCDLHMPTMNGGEFLRELSRAGFATPVVMLTSDEEVETELRLIQMGAAVFLRKSQDPRLLCAHVERILQKRNTQEAA